MWIYSLGITLRRTMHTFSSAASQQTKAAAANAANTADSTASKPKNDTRLEHVIRAMCAPNIVYRASLMYLLDVSIAHAINAILLAATDLLWNNGGAHVAAVHAHLRWFTFTLPDKGVFGARATVGRVCGGNQVEIYREKPSPPPPPLQAPCRTTDHRLRLHPLPMACCAFICARQSAFGMEPTKMPSVKPLTPYLGHVPAEIYAPPFWHRT